MTRRTLTEVQYQFLVSRPWVDEAVFAKIQRKIRSGEWTVLREPERGYAHQIFDTRKSQD